MLFKAKRIKQYLNNSKETISVFDELLKDYINGNFKSCFSEMGLSNIDIYVDWHTDYKCIELQGRYKKNYVDLQIEEDNFGFAVDLVEPDITNRFKLESKECVYFTCKNILSNIS